MAAGAVGRAARRGAGGPALGRAWAVLLAAAAAIAPRPVGGAGYGGVYGRVECSSDAAVTPSSTQELADAIRSHVAAAKGAGAGLKIRATHAVFHSSASFPCVPPSPSSPLPCSLSGGCGRGVVVFTDRLRGVLAADAPRRRLRVRAGTTVAELLAECKQRGWAPPIGAGTTYGGLTVGGVLATNAHDSGYLRPSSLAAIVTELTWVDAAGTVRTAPRDSDDARALLGGLGLVGIVAEVEVALQPTTNVRGRTRLVKGDGNLFGDIRAALQATPHLYVTWHPDQGLYSAFTKEETGDASTGAVLAPLATTQPWELPLLDVALKVWDGTIDGLGAVLDPVGCLSAVFTSPATNAISVPLGLPHYAGSIPGLAIPAANGVGDANDMLGCSCGGVPCAWDNGGPASVEPREFVIELADLGGWIDDVRRVFDQDLNQGKGETGRCIMGFVMLQFGSGSDAWLATTSGMREPVHAITMLTKSRALASSVPARYGFVHDILEQLSLCKYRGRPHPGKGSERTFTHPNCPLPDRYPQWSKLLDAQARYDPDLVFEPPLFARIKAREGYRLSPGCDLRKECFCSEDAHGAAGFTCAPSRAFPEFRACKPPALL